MGGKDGRSTASKPGSEAEGGEGEAEDRVPPGLPSTSIPPKAFFIYPPQRPTQGRAFLKAKNF